MGIEKFFSSIESNNVINKDGTISEINKNIISDYLGIDFNSIIHVTSQKTIRDINSILFDLANESVNSQTNKKMDKYKIKYDITFTKFTNKINDDYLDEIIIEQTMDNFFNILKKLVNPDKIKILYIAIDGVPGMAKIVEQKKRRYLGNLLGIMKNKLYQKHKKEVQKERVRYIFEENKVSWNKSKITPGTHFMDKLHNYFNDQTIIDEIKKICPNMSQYIYSGPYEPGEGEKKIVNYLRNKNLDNVIIFSPDSDVTLLALLLHAPSKSEILDENGIKDIKIIRHNQQKEIYDLVDITKLSDNIFNYSKLKFKRSIDHGRFIEDLVMIFTILGNDFVPKIESYDIKLDFNTIIDRYIMYLNNNTNDNFYLISLIKGKRKIEFNNLEFLLNILMKDEGGQLKNKYMASHFKNYNFLKKLLGEKDFILKLGQFTDKIKYLFDMIRQNKDLVYILNQIDKDTLKKMMEMIDIGKPIKFKNVEEMIEEIRDFYKRKNKMPFVRVFRYYTRSINDKFHKSSLEASLNYLDRNLKLLNYDIENYKMEHMLDEYVNKFKAYQLNLGMISLDPTHLSWTNEKIDDGVKKYYDTFFDIKDININNKKMNNLVSNYVESLISVFEYYYNWYDQDLNRQKPMIWFYKYHKAPLLTQIVDYMKTIKNFNKLNIMETVDRKDFLNPLEQMMFVTPVNHNMELVPHAYEEFVKNSEFYIDLNKVAEDILSERNNLMDCRGVIFINKCHINIVNNQIKVTDFVKILRRIPVSNEYNDLQGTMVAVSRVNKYDIHSTKRLAEFNNRSLKRTDGMVGGMGEMSKMIFDRRNKLNNQEDLSRKDKNDLAILKIMQEILNTEY